jgi:hypothetical protein
VHNSILKYASTASISIVMTMPLHVKPFEKKVFEEVIFLLKDHRPPPALKRWSIEKRERKNIEKRKKENEKEEEKEKLQESLQIKGKSIFRGEKHFNLKNLF